MMKHFGEYIRQQREKLRENDPEFSLRKIAIRIGVEPSFLSKVERGEQPPPSEAKIALLAEALGRTRTCCSRSRARCRATCRR